MEQGNCAVCVVRGDSKMNISEIGFGSAVWDFKLLAAVPLALLLLTVGLMTAIWYRRRRARLVRLIDRIPGPPSLPIIGNAIELNVEHDELMERMMGTTKLWGRRVGVNRTWVGSMPYMLVFHPDRVEPILGSNKHIEKSRDYSYLHPWLGTGLLTSSGTKWHSRRKIITPSFHFKILEDFIDVFLEQSVILVEKLSQEIGNDEGFNIFPYITHCTLDIVIQERKKELHEQKERSIPEHEVEDMTLGRKKRLAFLDLLLQASRNGTELSDEDIREEVDTFTFEGHDTTSAAISWALFLLGGQPDIQDKVVEEIDRVLGTDPKKRFTMKDLNDLKYLECCIKEALRLYPSVPLIARHLKEDVSIAHYTVPAGTTAIIVTYMLHRNPEIFPHPEKFNPDNFLPENVLGRHPYAYIPFSAGPRNCIGQKFAMLEEKAVISSILRKYRVEAVDRREDLILLGELILRPKHGLRVKIFPRTS